MIKIVDKIEDANCITHSGTIHVDETFATAFLDLYLKDITVYRTSNVNPNEYSQEIYIYDVGRGKYDHHQEDAKRRDNNIKYSSFGLLWQEYGRKFLKQEGYKNIEELFLRIDKNLVEGIDAIDNGVFPKIEAPYKVKTISDIIKIFNPSYASEEEENTQFLKAVLVAREILIEEIKNARGKIIAKEKVLKKLKQTNTQFLLLEEYMPYEEALLTEDLGKNIVFVIFPSNRGGYGIKTVPKSMEDRTSRVQIPKEWAGLSNQELEEKTGVKGVLFCHSERFLMTCKTKKTAIEVVKKIINNETI